MHLCRPTSWTPDHGGEGPPVMTVLGVGPIAPHTDGPRHVGRRLCRAEVARKSPVQPDEVARFVRSRFFRLVIRSSTGWSERDRARVLARAKGLGSPPSQVTARGFELSVGADTAEAARTRVELAVHGIHSHTGVYLAEEIGEWS